MRWLWALVASVSLGVPGICSGRLEAELSLLPTPALRAVVELSGSVAGISLASTSVMHLGTWVWQEFSGVMGLGAAELEGIVLFGPSTVDFVYDQVGFTLELPGLEMGFYAAQLSGAVLGGPASGAVLRLGAELGSVWLEAITEFGATLEGIEIFHAATGLSRKYPVDPRPPGAGFTAQRLSLTGIALPRVGCGRAGAEVYFTKENGFERAKFSVDELFRWCCPTISFSAEVVFELQTKAVALVPRVVAEPFCLTPYFEVAWDGNELGGIEIAGLEYSCELDGARLRGITLFERCCWAISTPEYGSEVVRCFEADREGIEYFREYWELVSLEFRGQGCCGGEWRFLFNSYFGDQPGLLGWGMSYLELDVPLGEGLGAKGILQVSRSGVDRFVLEGSLSW